MNQYPNWVTPATTTHCVRSGHKIPPKVVPGTDLCGACHNAFRRELTDLVELWPALTSSVIRQPVQQLKERVQTSGGGDAGSLWNPGVARAIAEISDWTAFLIRLLIREYPSRPNDRVVQYIPQRSVPTWDARRSTRPLTDAERRREFVRVTQTADNRRAVSSTASPGAQLAAIVVRDYARWLSRYPGLGVALLDDAEQLRRAAADALDSQYVQRVLLKGKLCTDVVEETELGPILCEGQLVAIIRPEDRRKPSSIVCSANPTHTSTSVADWILHD